MDNKLKTVDAETLLSTPMSKTMFIVDGLISQGVNVISGASKIGKSWLMLWLGLQVAQGNSIWGLPTLQCDVLYLSLEDTQRRIKDRLYNLTDSAPDNLYFAVTSGLIGGGLEEQITDFLTEHPATKLVIIDTLQKVRDSKGSAGKAGMYGNDYDDISSIKRIADGFNIAILLVHHLRKLQDSDDPFNDVSGSTGIIGAADTNFILRRKRSGMITTRKLCLQLWVQLRQRSLYVIRSQVAFPTFTCRRKKDHSSRRFLLILGMGALLSAVSAGVAVSAVILYHLGIIFGFFLPYKPVKKSFGICG